MTGAAKNTVTKLLVDLGMACEEYQDINLRGLTAKNVQCDEIWSFVGCKEKNKAEDAPEFGTGDVWTWTAMDADTKLMISWFIGDRSMESGKAFLSDLATRIENRPQVSTDGHRVYFRAVADAFDGNVDHGMLVKHYGLDHESQRRYSPTVCTGATKEVLMGKPDPALICTSHVERSNLTMRMSMRRFTRLTNAFSKKAHNHAAAIALHFMHYNFCRKHQTLKTTPAVAAGVTDHVWTIEEMIETVLA
jgi:IS1 family transposase